MSSLADSVAAFQARRARIPVQPPTLCPPDAFPLLLAGVPALRKTPGLATPEEAGKDYFLTVPYCLSRENRQKTRDYLHQVYGITDLDSMIAFCSEQIWVHPQYLDFESFWEGRPAFSLDELNPGPRDFFRRLSDFARQFQPFVGRRGFLAWDISETLGHLRLLCACELISPEEYRDLSRHWVEQAAAFHSWEEYAVGLVCGAAFWAYRTGGDHGLQDAADYLDLNLRLVNQLLNDRTAWAGRMWYRPPQSKPFRLSAPEMRELLPDWEGPEGCLATDQIVVEGRPVGYCYREEPDGTYPDSGWRFFSGEEDDEYVNDPGHTGIYRLNTICNYDPDILPLLTAPYGTAYARGEDGNFYAEPLVPPEPRSPADGNMIEPLERNESYD